MALTIELKQLSEKLGEIERDILLSEFLNSFVRGNKSLVQRWVEKLIYPSLGEYQSEMLYTGSNYELTAVPFSSDYDLQFCFKVKAPNGRKPRVEDCGKPGWKKIRGGPPEFLNEQGYLSAYKVRQTMLSRIDKARAEKFRSIPDEEAYKYAETMKRSVSGPAVTLNFKRYGKFHFSVDIVACVKGADLENGGDFDLVGKPVDESRPDEYDDMWRMSYSQQEKKLLREFDAVDRYDNKKHFRRVLTLFRIMKIIKTKQTQLAQLPSYFYKNIIFNLYKKKSCYEDWTASAFPARFVDMIEDILAALGNKDLRMFFNKDVNLLEKYQKNPMKALSLTNACNYLDGILGRRSYLDLFDGITPDDMMKPLQERKTPILPPEP